jgi:TonB family protein
VRVLITLLFVFVAAPRAAFPQAPGGGQAATPNPPRPVLSEAVTDARLRALFDAARAAIVGMRFDEALRLSDEGLAAAPNQPAFWLNRADALYARAVVTYNRFYRSAEEAERKAGLEASRRDFRDALAAATRGLALVDDYPAPADEALRVSLEALRRAALWLRAQALMACAIRVDESYYPDAVTALEQYAGAETDPAMSNLAHYYKGQLMIATNDPAGAAAEFRKVFDAEPGNVEALLGEAVALVNQGYKAGDPARLQEGFERLRLFTEKAEGHRVRASAARALEYFRRGESPQEVTAAGRDGEPGRQVEGGVINGRAISKPAPPYPLIAKAARAGGTVTVRVVVDEQGEVVSAWATSGHPLLRAAAVEAASQAKFTPTLLSGKPVKVGGTITYNFVLEQ